MEMHAAHTRLRAQYRLCSLTCWYTESAFSASPAAQSTSVIVPRQREGRGRERGERGREDPPANSHRNVLPSIWLYSACFKARARAAAGMERSFAAAVMSVTAPIDVVTAICGGLGQPKNNNGMNHRTTMVIILWQKKTLHPTRQLSEL
jgi:hypothetical protein